MLLAVVVVVLCADVTELVLLLVPVPTQIGRSLDSGRLAYMPVSQTDELVPIQGFQVMRSLTVMLWSRAMSSQG